MAKRILVPLDLTPASYAKLAFVADLARAQDATVRLLYVAPAPDNVIGADGRLVAYADQEAARIEAGVLDRLRALAGGLVGTTVDCAVRFGDPSDQILDEAQTWDADTIVLGAGVRSRFLRLVNPGVAGRVFARSPVPVVLVRTVGE